MTDPAIDTAGLRRERAEDVLRALARVDDPELDEPVTELKFIDRVDIADDGAVAIGFRLPTYWCAANFAFLMADDMRREVASLPWVSRVAVTLGEHMYAETINHGLASGQSFQACFGEAADGDLHALRQTFLVKAFQRRQEALLRQLLAERYPAELLAALSVQGLAELDLSANADHLRRRYLERRHHGAAPGETLAFVDATGRPLAAAAMASYLQSLSRVGINAEFNGALCRSLLAARFNEAPSAPDAEPTLRDFIIAAANQNAGPRGAST